MSEKIAYLDCYSGISGNMFLGAFLDAGLSLDTIREGLRGLPLTGYDFSYKPYIDHGISGTQFDVILTAGKQPWRGFREIAALLQESTLSPFVRETALAIFRSLGEAEAAVHSVSLDEVHFHEVGAVDAIIDITGAALAMEALEITQLYASPLPLTRGNARMAHGLMPLPAPATLEILSKVQAPWVPCAIEAELVTPTGAAILATLARFETPAIKMERIGYGFGTKRLSWPNCLRVYLGQRYTASLEHHHDHEHEHEHHHERIHAH